MNSSKTSNFELNLKIGGVFTYLNPPEDIGIKCQKEPFDLEFLRDTLQGKQDTGTIQEERLERIPSVKKLVGPEDVLPREEAEYNVRQYCRSYNHDTKACRKQHNNIPSPTHSQIATGYHPTATPPPLMGTTAATQPTGTHNNPLFNLLDNNQPRTSTIMHTPHNGTSPATPADLVEGITQIMNQVTSNNKRDDASKKMMKNIKIFDSSNKAECITWLSQVQAADKFTNTAF